MISKCRTLINRYDALIAWLMGIVTLVVALVTWGPSLAFAQVTTWTLQQRQTNSLIKDGDAIESGAVAGRTFGQVIAGYDGSDGRFILTDATGALQVDVLSGGGAAEDFTIADNAANPSPVQPVASFLMGYESIGAVYDRLRMDTNGNLYTTLATAIDSSIDSISIAINDVIPQLDSTDRVAVSAYFFNAAAGDTQPTATTTQADNLAGTLDTLNVTTFQLLYDGTTFDLWRGFVGNADDLTAPTANGLAGTFSLLAGWDQDDSNLDRIYGMDTDNDSVTVLSEANALATAAFNFVYDSSTSNDWDRLTKNMVTGAGVPGATTTLGVDGTSSCMAALAVGTYRIVPVANGQSITHCCRSGSSCSAVTTDAPYIDGQYYYETVTDSSANDVICCILEAAGTNELNIYATLLTF